MLQFSNLLRPVESFFGMFTFTRVFICYVRPGTWRRPCYNHKLNGFYRVTYIYTSLSKYRNLSAYDIYDAKLRKTE